MKKSHLLLVTIFIGLTLLMSACVPGPRVVDAPGLALDDSEVFVSYGNFISSLDAAKGTVNWSYPEKADNQIIFYAPPLVTDDAVYIGDLANEFHKLDKATGEAIWTYSGAKGFYLGQAAIQDDVVYAPNNDGALYALSSDGDLLWTFETGHYLWAQPQIANDMIYIGSMDHFVYALSLDGTEIWSYELSGAVTGAPLLSEDGSMLYVGSLNNEMLALDTASGNVVWTFEAAESVWGNSVLAEGNLYFSDAAGTIYAISAESGEADWQTATSAEVVGGVSSIGDGIVVATQEGQLRAFAYDGSPKWEASLDGEIIYAPVANSDFLIAGIINGDELLYGFNLTGVQLWSTTPGN
jgi:outer membrane protein assembly factor BamB